MAVGELLGDDGEVVGQHQAQGVGVREAVGAGHGFFEQAAGGGRVIEAGVQRGELADRGQQFRVALGEARFSLVDGVFEDRLGLGDLAGIREGLRLVAGLGER
ncbi:hypothetical protein GCM10010435_93410 [Winogradskya consettensis]